MLSICTAKRAAYVYLAIPLVLFAIGWLNYAVVALLGLLIVAAVVELWRTPGGSGGAQVQWTQILTALAILGVWVLLSGVGGYTFQNWDHHSRNAVFHDLITYQWPVVYHLDAAVVSQFHIPDKLILSYYFGFWLPAALVGKLFGWNAANFALFLWTWLGVALIVVLTATKLRITYWKAALLLIFFSGMDVLGVLLLQNIRAYTYPTLWPPVQHLEWWAGALQYSSFTTDLFWTYNQTVPALLVVALLLLEADARPAILLTGICAFYAPLPAVGLVPFVVGVEVRDIVRHWRDAGASSRLAFFARRLLTPQTVAGIAIGSLSLLLFSANLAGQSRSIGLPAPFLIFVIFSVLEWLVVWICLLPLHKRDWTWYTAGAVLLIAPFINVGGTWDFMMRASIPALYVLMQGAGEFLATHKMSGARIVLLVALCLGALTPLYEMDRSIVRTARYYGPPLTGALTFDSYFADPPKTDQPFIPEIDHSSTLTADDWGTVINMHYEGWRTKAGRLFNPFWRWLWRSGLSL